MSDQWANKVDSPGPGWTTLRDPTSSGDDGAVDVKEGHVKKRKGVDDNSIAGSGVVGSSSKRARHSVTGLVDSIPSSSKAALFSTLIDKRALNVVGSGKSRAVSNRSAVGGPSTAPSSPTFLHPFGLSGAGYGATRIWTNTASVNRPIPSRSATQPTPARGSATITKDPLNLGQSTKAALNTTSSTASTLAAQLSLVHNPHIVNSHKDEDGGGERASERGREKEKEKEKGEWDKEKEPSPITPEYFGDSSDGNTSPTIGLASDSNAGRSAGKRVSSLAGPGVFRGARYKDERGPLLVDKRRQVARKTGGSSKSPRKFQFDREVTSSDSISGADSSSDKLPGSGHMHVDRDGADVSSKKRTNDSPKAISGSSPLHTPPIFPGQGSSEGKERENIKVDASPRLLSKRNPVRKSATGTPPSRTLFGSPSQSSGKAKEREHASAALKSRQEQMDVIVIDSSSDDEASQAKVIDIGLSPKQRRPTIAKEMSSSESSSGAKAKMKGKGKSGESIPGSSLDLIEALNETYQKPRSQGQSPKKPIPAKALEQDIIDLTIESSDDAPARAPAPVPHPKSPRSPEKLNSLTSWVKRVPRKQLDSSTILAHVPVPAPVLVSMREPAGPKATIEFPVETSKEDHIPRPRSAPLTTRVETPLIAGKPKSTELSPSSPIVESPPHFIPLTKTSQSEDSSAAEEYEVYQAMVGDNLVASPKDQSGGDDGMGASIGPPSSGPSSRTSPELVPPLRRSLRYSSGASLSGTEHLKTLTDDEYVETPPASSPSPGPGPDDTGVSPIYGGFKALTWEEHKKDLGNFNFKHYLAKDIPTSLPDSINRLSRYARMDQGIREIFSAFMLESIAEDEAGAPDIEIVNDVDDEPTPLFEFNYSNRMWYGEGVPLPDYAELKGCDCVGRCDPKSKTCSCAIRQRSVLQEDGFVYEKNGRLKHHGYPIFECNDLCACDDDCRNRVVQHGRRCPINIKKTANKGWGVFNGPRKIPKGSFIGVYAGELLTDEQGEARGRYYNKIGRTYLFDIDFWHLKSPNEPGEWQIRYTVDAYHAGNFTRFLNHSCDPNARLYACYINEPDIEKPLLVVFSIRDVEPYEEICFNYLGKYPEDDPDDDEEQKQEIRDDPVYMECKCGAYNCTGAMFK